MGVVGMYHGCDCSYDMRAAAAPHSHIFEPLPKKPVTVLCHTALCVKTCCSHVPMFLLTLHSPPQGSVTSWRSCCESFSSVSKLVRLQHLNLHAFHCPGR